MSTIVAGRFQLQEQASGAIAALQAAGFAAQNVASFFVNPSGQHNLYPVGGDADNSPEAQQAPGGTARGVRAGAVIGALVTAVGLATLQSISALTGLVLEIVGAGVGAYMGSLFGALASLGAAAAGETGPAPPQAEPDHAPLRKSGMVVAVATAGQPEETDAVRVLLAQGAAEVERSEGIIADGHWPDFDPLKPVVLVEPPADSNQVRPVSQ